MKGAESFDFNPAMIRVYPENGSEKLLYEVLDVHPDVHPATFDGARDHRMQLRDLRAKIQGDLRDIPRSCTGLWLHEYHVIVYVNSVYCVIVVECN